MGAYGSPDLSNNGDNRKKKKKPLFKRWWFWLLVIVIIGAIGSSGGDKDTPKETSSTKQHENKVETKKEEPKDEFYGIGEIAETKAIKATITDVEKSEGDQFNKPSDGNEFILININIENLSDNDIAISSVLSFNSYVDDESMNESISALMTKDKKSLDGTMAPGKKLSGTLGYEVPKGWKEIEIHFEPEVFRDNKIKFKIQND